MSACVKLYSLALVCEPAKMCTFIQIAYLLVKNYIYNNSFSCSQQSRLLCGELLAYVQGAERCSKYILATIVVRHSVPKSLEK